MELIPVLINVVQEWQEAIEQVEARIADLEEEWNSQWVLGRFTEAHEDWFVSY